MQLTFVIMGGLGLAVSVLTLRGSEGDPSLLAVNPDTDISYCVAGSEMKSASQNNVGPGVIATIRLLLFKLTQISNSGRGGARIRYCLPLNTRGLEDTDPDTLILILDVTSELSDVDSVTEELGSKNVGI